MKKYNELRRIYLKSKKNRKSVEEQVKKTKANENGTSKSIATSTESDVMSL